MNPDVIKTASEVGLWLISASVIAVIMIQAFAYMKLSFKTAKEVNFPEQKCKEAIKVGMVTAIGPSIGVFIVMVGMMAVLGVPLTWMRLATIGAAPTELMAATVGAQAVGVQFGGAGYDLHALSASIWTMTINSAGWLLVTFIFARNMEDIRNKIGGGDPKWLGILSVGAAVGCFGFQNISLAVGAYRGVQRGAPFANGPIFAIVGGLVSMLLLLKLAQKLKWLREYTLGIAMLCGMALAMLLRS